MLDCILYLGKVLVRLLCVKTFDLMYGFDRERFFFLEKHNTTKSMKKVFKGIVLVLLSKVLNRPRHQNI